MLCEKSLLCRHHRFANIGWVEAQTLPHLRLWRCCLSSSTSWFVRRRRPGAMFYGFKENGLEDRKQINCEDENTHSDDCSKKSLNICFENKHEKRLEVNNYEKHLKDVAEQELFMSPMTGSKHDNRLYAHVLNAGTQIKKGTSVPYLSDQVKFRKRNSYRNVNRPINDVQFEAELTLSRLRKKRLDEARLLIQSPYSPTLKDAIKENDFHNNGSTLYSLPSKAAFQHGTPIATTREMNCAEDFSLSAAESLLIEKVTTIAAPKSAQTNCSARIPDVNSIEADIAETENINHTRKAGNSVMRPEELDFSLDSTAPCKRILRADAPHRLSDSPNHEPPELRVQRQQIETVGLNTPYGHAVPNTGGKLLEMMSTPVCSPPNSRVLRIAILGVPNAGKSTLINALVEDELCSVSKKVNTTRCLARAVYTTDDTQLIFLDTPGVLTSNQIRKHKLSGPVVEDSERSLKHADLLVVLHDCISSYSSHGIHPRLLKMLALYPHIPAVLVLNKADRVNPQTHLLKLTRLLTEGGRLASDVIENSSRSEGSHKPLIDEFYSNKTADVDQLASNIYNTFRSRNETPNCVEFSDHDSEEKQDCQKILKRGSVPISTTDMQQISFSDLEANCGIIKLPSYRESKTSDDGAKISDEDVFTGRVKLTDEQATELIHFKKGWPFFKAVFITSALERTGVPELRKALLAEARPGRWLYPANMVTDQDPYQLAALIVREKFLDKFNKRLPYDLKFDVEHWEVGKADTVHIVVRVVCDLESTIKYLVGSKGSHLKKIGDLAEKKLAQIFKSDVLLRINVVSQEGLKEKKDAAMPVA